MSLVENKKAHLNYEIIEKYEAGLELTGGEVKSVRNKQGSLEGARVLVRGGEAYLVGSTIPPYQVANQKDYDPARNRRLLLTKKELQELASRGEMKGLTIVPLAMYNKGRYLKLSLALARGKKQFDKREDIKRRDIERDIGRTLKK